MAAKIGGPDLTFDDSAAPSPFPDRYTSQAISQPQTMAQPIMRVVQWYYRLSAADPDLNTVGPRYSNKAPFGSLGTGRSWPENLPCLFKFVKDLCGWESFPYNRTGPKSAS